MKNIYIFNIGKVSEQLEKNLAILKDKKYNVVVGPSHEEHKYLMANYPYYNKSIELGLYSFASDVWRFYILSKNEGLYLDTSLSIGKNFDDFYNEVSRYDAWIPKIHDQYLNGPVMYSKSHPLFLEMLEFFKKYDEKTEIRDFPIGPRVITIVALKHNLFIKDMWDAHYNKENKVMLGTVMQIRNKDTIYKYGSGSWFKNKWFRKIAAKQGWKKIEREFNTHSVKYRESEAWWMINKYL